MSWILLAISSPTQPPKLRVATGHRWDLSLLVTLVANSCHVFGIVSERYPMGHFELLWSNFLMLARTKIKGGVPKDGREARDCKYGTEKSHIYRSKISINNILRLSYFGRQNTTYLLAAQVVRLWQLFLRDVTSIDIHKPIEIIGIPSSKTDT